MIPYRDNSDKHVQYTQGKVENKKQEISLIRQTNTVVNPRTMMVHGKYTYVANCTVMSPGWFRCFACFAFLRPNRV